jgi:hypothetical protein
MRSSRTARAIALAFAATEFALQPAAALAAPSAEVAKRCIHYSYVVYPFKRPGAVPMSGDRQAYFKDCIAKSGDVPVPTPPAKDAKPPTPAVAKP